MIIKYHGLQIIKGNAQSVQNKNFVKYKILQWEVSVVSIFQLLKETWCRLMKCPIFGGYTKIRVARKAILNTKEYANVNESNYFNMSKTLIRISEVW